MKNKSTICIIGITCCILALLGIKLYAQEQCGSPQTITDCDEMQCATYVITYPTTTHCVANYVSIYYCIDNPTVPGYYVTFIQGFCGTDGMCHGGFGGGPVYACCIHTASQGDLCTQ